MLFCCSDINRGIQNISIDPDLWSDLKPSFCEVGKSDPDIYTVIYSIRVYFEKTR